MSTELTTTNTTELSADVAQLYQSDVICDDFGSNDLAYGWLRIAQSNTEQQKKGSASRIPGLEAGHFFNSLTSKVYGETVNVIFLKFFHSFREQEPGDKGKFVRSIDKDEFEHLKEIGQVKFVDGWIDTVTGNVIKESWNYMVMLPDDPEAGVLRLAFGPGAKKYCDAWNTQIKMSRLPNGSPAAPFSSVWSLTLALDANKSGTSYYSIGASGRSTVKKVGLTPPSIIAEVKGAYEFFQKQSAKKVVESERQVSEEEGDPL